MKKAIFGTFFICVFLLVGCGDLDDNLPETKYSITYSGNGNSSGYVPIDSNQYLPGSEAIVLGKGSIERIGFNFLNWNTNQQGTGTSYGSGDIIVISNSNITLYAIWDELPKYTVTFETYGGSSVESISNIITGLKINIPATPAKQNFSFEGWYIDEEFTVEWNFQNDIVDKDLTLYAKWISTLYPYEVTNISGYRVGLYLFVSWTNPTDDNFSHVRVILAGFEWAESSGMMDQEPGITSYSAADFAGTEYVIIKSVGKDGSVSEGIIFYF